MEFAEGDPPPAEDVGEEGGEVGSGADDDFIGGDGAVGGEDAAGFYGVGGGALQEGDAVLLREPGGEAGDGVAAFDAELVRGVQGGEEIGAQRGVLGEGVGAEDAAGFAHFGSGKVFQDGDGFGAAGGDEEAALVDVDAGLGGDLRPDVAGAAGAAPGDAGGLAGDGDEAEIADRGAGCLGVAVQHGGAQAAAAGGERMGEADDAGPDDGHVVRPVGRVIHGGNIADRPASVRTRRRAAAAGQHALLGRLVR